MNSLECGEAGGGGEALGGAGGVPGFSEDDAADSAAPRGGSYAGDLKDGKRHGRGTMRFANGNVYEGEWKNDKKHGKGTFTWDDGDVYEGVWEDGKRCGQGTMKYPDGDVYEGEWRDGKQHGQGKYTWHNGGVYEGAWKDNKRHGQGTMKYADGGAYKGEWKSGKVHGQGKYTAASGNVYEGEWENGKKHGAGVFTEASSGVRYNERYDRGKQQSCKRLAPFAQANKEDVGERVDNFFLMKEHTTCGICFDKFACDTSSRNEEVRKRLPVSSTCGHWYCHGCVLGEQAARAQSNNGQVPHRINCMYCREEGAFCPSKPVYNRLLIELLQSR